MKLKIFLILCVSSFLISFPQNIIGCGPDTDPYDYYTSFYNADVVSSPSYRSFYYTNYRLLYDEFEQVSQADVLAKEWKNYCGNTVTVSDAKSFVMEYSREDVYNLYNNIEKKTALKIPDSVKQNSMTTYFIQKKDLEALGYIIYAKKVEPLVNVGYNSWDPIKKETVTMDKQIKAGMQLYAASKSELFKLKYGYQITRLAHYSGNYNTAIKYYDEYIANNKTESILKPISLAIKAGAMFRLGQKKEAAYIYSKVFSEIDVKKVAHYLSFQWAIDVAIPETDYLQLCKTDAEKANMLVLFTFAKPQNQVDVLNQIFTLNPQNKALETIVAREINKLEENYYSNTINTDAGGKLFYYGWNERFADSTVEAGKQQVLQLKNTLLKIAQSTNVDKGFYYTSAAYCALMIKDFTKANEYLTLAKASTLTPKINDQWMLTNLLLAINEGKKIDADTELKILPSIKWLQQKALKDKGKNNDWSYISTWQKFYRNIMTIALAKKYHAQGDIYKEVLTIGAADNIISSGNNFNTVDFLHNKTDLKDVEKLYSFMNEKKGNEFETYLLNNNALKIADVIEFAGTAYLRNYDYNNAIKWLQKPNTGKKEIINKDAFIDLLYDQQERTSTKETSTTKLAFAQEMQRLQTLSTSDKTNTAKHLYKIATGLYNITYYGHAWELVQYYRSGSDGYYIPENATAFEKQYYGCYAAHDMFKQAMDASADKNFKAKCLFMMAKCAQKQVGAPQYFQFASDYDGYSKANKAFKQNFMSNKYFPQFVAEYKGTAFFEDATTSCSYLFDFVQKNK